MTEELDVSNDVDEVVEAEVEAQEPLSGESPEESGDTGDNQESNESKPLFSEEGQKVFNAKMAEAKRQTRELEAEKQKYADQLQQMQSQLPQNQRPSVPELPDRYDFDSDEDYRQASATRDAKMRELVNFETQERFKQVQAQRQQEQGQRAAQEQMKTTLTEFQQNAVKVGIESSELNQNIETVNSYGIDQNLGIHIMSRPDGPLITKYLAANPGELDRLNQSDPYTAASIVATEIAQKAANLKPRTTNAPDPLSPLRGSGSTPKERGPKGATFV